MKPNAKRRGLLIAAIAVPLVLALLFAGVSYFLGTQIVAGSTQLVTNASTKDVPEGFWEQYGVDYDAFCSTYQIEHTELVSTFDGHAIPVDYIHSGDRSRDVVVMVHGLGGNRLTNYPIAEFFLENGYNVISYDQRSSGENTADKTTFGYWEKYDLIDCITYAEGFVSDGTIGVWGESFGGATAVQAMAYGNVQDSVAFLVLDCPVSSMAWMVEQEMAQMELGIPLGYMMWCGSLVNQMELGFSYQDADSALIAEKIHIPTLVINSQADETTPYFMGMDIYDNLASAEKELWTVPDSAHVGMWLDYPETYREKLLALMQ